MKWSLASLFWLVTYIATLLVVTGVVIRLRAVALGVYGTSQAQAEWNVWRADAKKMSEESYPVKRRVPTGSEPPALVMMRDHFDVTIAGALVLWSLLFGTFMVLARGAFQSRPITSSATNRKKMSSRSSGSDGVGGLL